MIRYEDDCVGCPQGCIHCGRGKYPVWECDKCGAESVNGDDMYEVDGKHYCGDCYYEMGGDFAAAVTVIEAEKEKARYE